MKKDAFFKARQAINKLIFYGSPKPPGGANKMVQGRPRPQIGPPLPFSCLLYIHFDLNTFVLIFSLFWSLRVIDPASVLIL